VIGLWLITLLGQIGLRTHAAGFGITIGLPASWKADSAGMKSAGTSELRELAASNQNALLFRARDSLVPANTISLNVTASPDMQRTAFAGATPDEIDKMVKGLCDRFAAQVKENGGAGRCLDHEIRTLDGRKVLVIQQEAAIRNLGVENRRVVALFPSDGLLPTLNYSVAKAQFDTGVARAILASLQFKKDPF
jgi:hypothetical protein